MNGPRRYRVWCEALAPEVLGAPATRALLRRYGLEPLVALPPGAETGTLRDALTALSADGIAWGLWPLLDDADGYWLSTANATHFCARVAMALEFAPARPRTIAVDLEPPIALTRALTVGGDRRALLGAVWASVGPEASRARDRARVVLDELTGGLRSRGIETLAAVLPPVVLDLDARHRPVQALLSTPLDPTSCDVISPMLYTSMIAGLLPGRSTPLARRILGWSSRRMVARRGAQGTSIGLGVVGTGKLGDEPTYQGPDELAEDVRIALAAGARDLALFSLEGVLGREGGPEPWLRALTQLG